MTTQHDTHPNVPLVFLLDVDNTLLDNDRLKEDLSRSLDKQLGADTAARFWSLYEDVRIERGFVDIPLTAKRFLEERNDPVLTAELNGVLQGISFSAYLYPHAVDVLAYLRTLGLPVILSDGDQVFQRRKIDESGLATGVDDRVMISVHKEEELGRVFGAYPADHYVVVDDKPRIIAALERECPARFTTVLVLQGKYARDTEFSPKPDITLDAIGDLLDCTRDALLQHVHHVPGLPPTRP